MKEQQELQLRTGFVKHKSDLHISLWVWFKNTDFGDK